MHIQNSNSNAHLKDLPMERNTENEEIMSSRANASQQIHALACLENMPYDIINMIFTYTTFKDAVCIGLTCPKLYGYLKAYHKAPIPLTVPSACSAPSTAHCHHKHSFSGPTILAQSVAHWKTFSTYRFVGAPIFRFLNCDVYGGQPGEGFSLHHDMVQQRSVMEQALRDRYTDCYRSLQGGATFYGGQEIEWPASSILLSPHGMGLDWYRAAFEIIERSVHDFSLAFYSDAWRARWKPFNVFKNNEKYFDNVAMYWHGVRSRRSVAELERKREERLKNILTPEPKVYG